jgi:uncharacterized protein YceK
MCLGGGPCRLDNNKIYIGTRKDAEAIREYKKGEKLFPAIDLPLSFALDTIFLPYTTLSFLVEMVTTEAIEKMA